VKATAQEFGVPYFEQPTFLAAVASHARTLRDIGRAAPEPDTEVLPAPARA